MPTMNTEEMQSYLSNIEEYVFDEKKVVTCSWLSKTLGIHVNVSKQLLHCFYESSSKKDELSATYLVIGVPSDGETYKVIIAKDKDLQEVENTLKLITSKHIYSIQKSLDLADFNVLYTAQKGDFDTISKGISAIDFNCNERGNTLIEKLKANALPNVSNQTTAKKPVLQTNKTKSSNEKEKNDQSNLGKTCAAKEESASKTENKGAVVPSMFKNCNVSKKKPAEKVVPNKKSQGIGAFFSKATNKQINEPKKVYSKPDIEQTKEESGADSKLNERLSPLKENKATLNICNENNTPPKLVDTPKEPPVKSKKPEEAKTKTTSNKKKANTKRSKKTSGNKAEKDSKKRKRLVVLSDSDSNSSEDEEDEVKREPTPEPEPTLIPNVVEDDDDMVCGTPEPSRKRKKKLISKTFTSDEGYMVTEKQYVDASCSEDEETVPEKKFKESSTTCEADNTKIVSKTEKPEPKDKKVSPKAKNSSPQKTKQASLMSFFKKK